ncbi:hypothetical protein F441_07880 [Phytophthora nicotianae CJ01A1]|uniref:Uncharacterized protein n=3 Tax=Phytophthora nicotianae TaxID=4792 RepID=W2LAR4_PHYNI|nr:hypothetical protein L915_07741 [Phytophthora nicotianae]ETO76691.1 hypothetical protein F444_07957 [Phytophthora nicotianae P1976]ETP17767.1 hypothetical protein F441_07880 [Phytophthora nicotianae CJ01A1]ETL41313.1 hypothetical protein L916_07670 [Phytophthora nicotianae]ETL94487.1 hypothetical protein L917_07554 [Phytophthora nicotianae]
MSGNVSIGSCGGGTTRSAGTRSDNVNTPAILQLPLHPTAPLKKVATSATTVHRVIVVSAQQLPHRVEAAGGSGVNEMLEVLGVDSTPSTSRHCRDVGITTVIVH